MGQPIDNILASVLYVIRDKSEIMATDENLRFFHFCMKYAESNKFKGQNFQDAWITYELFYRLGFHGFDPDKSIYYYVEFGAANGLEMSNTDSLQSIGFKGLLCEPNQKWHDELVKNRSRGVGAELDFRCVSDTTGDRVRFVDTPDPLHSTMEEFVNSDYNASMRQNGEIALVETVTLYDLLRQHNAPKNITYISTDTEGSEYKILDKFFKQNDYYNVDYFTIEHNFNPIVQKKLDDLMTANGYELRFPEFSRWDAFYRRRIN